MACGPLAAGDLLSNPSATAAGSAETPAGLRRRPSRQAAPHGRLYGEAVVLQMDVSSLARTSHRPRTGSQLIRGIMMPELPIRGRWAGLLAVLGLALAPRTSGSEDIAGKYKVAGTAHVAISPFPTQDYPGEMTATLSKSSAPDAFSLRLEARGYACTLRIRGASDGSLYFPDGAICPFDVSQPDARGHVNAQLRAGRGRVVGTRLEMDLQFEVSGSIQVWIPSRTIRVLGAEFQTPATWAPTAPVRGTAAASGSGARQHPDPSAL